MFSLIASWSKSILCYQFTTLFTWTDYYCFASYSQGQDSVTVSLRGTIKGRSSTKVNCMEAKLSYQHLLVSSSPSRDFMRTPISKVITQYTVATGNPHSLWHKQLSPCHRMFLNLLYAFTEGHTEKVVMAFSKACLKLVKSMPFSQRFR